MTILAEGRTAIDAELMDMHLFADGDMQIDPVPGPPDAQRLVLEPPSVAPPSFEELLRSLEREELGTPPTAARHHFPATYVNITDEWVHEDPDTVGTHEDADTVGRHEDTVGRREDTVGRREDTVGRHAARGGILTVFSPKGGSGTTFVATSLALLLAEHGRRRVCLVDLDLQFGDVAISTGLSPNRGIVDGVGLDPASDELVAALVTPWHSGVDCVLAPVDPSTAEQVTPELVAAVLLQLRRAYDYVVVDTPSQLSEHVLEALEISDHQVLVCTAEVAGLKNMRLVLDTLNLLGHGTARRSVVLNRSDHTRSLGAEEIEGAIVHPIAAVIPASAEVAIAVDEGTPLVLERAEHPVTVALHRFVSDVLTGEPVTVKRRGGRLGMRSRTRSA